MITDTVKEYLVSKRFGNVGYAFVILHFICLLVLTGITAALRANEIATFSCSVDQQSAETYQKQINKACLAEYDQVYNSPIPLYGFVLLSIGLSVVVSVVYSLIVRTRVDEIESNYKRLNDDEAAQNHEPGRQTVYVFNCYCIHLVLRLAIAITCTVLQYKYIYTDEYELKFSCGHNGTVVLCENLNASGKRNSGQAVSVINGIVGLVILVEVIYLCLRHLIILNRRYESGWNVDSELVLVYFLGKRYEVPNERHRMSIVNATALQDSVDFYKEQVLNRPPAPDIYCGQNACLEDFYIDVVIHTGRAKHDFSKAKERHEIYDVYMDVPEASIHLEKTKDLFCPNKDTKNEIPRSILVIGRPGIGKTVLTEKLLRDWANKVDKYYSDKIAFYFKLRWFSNYELESMSLKEFLRYGTRLTEEDFESIYEQIMDNPQQAVLIFDGLDELYGNPLKWLERASVIPDDANTIMPPINLFIKLVLGGILKGATILVTSRPNANDFYSKFRFDRNVEIIGFTSDKIEEYVTRFCNNNNKSDLKSKIWNHIKSSSELLNLCYIPVNSFIVCGTLSDCISEPGNDISTLPTTLTEIYQNALRYFEKRDHDRNGILMTGETLKKFQELAFRGMKNDRLIFDQEFVDEEMKKSFLLNSLSNPVLPIQTQFCFIHLTIQEFLAATYVTETFTPEQIKKFISDHLKNIKWHSVLQFIGGRLGYRYLIDSQYKNCVSAFTENFRVIKDRVWLDYHEVFVMKCLREFGNEEILREICETSAMNDVVNLCRPVQGLSPSDLAAVIFVCKNMKNLKELNLSCAKLSDQGEIVLWNILCEGLCKLHKLYVDGCSLTPDSIPSLVTALQDERCQLTVLSLRNNSIRDKGAEMIFNDALTNERCKLTELNLDRCSLTDQCISSLCTALQDKRCKLTVLSLKGNSIMDEVAKKLFENALAKKNCKLTQLNLDKCSLTYECIRSLCKALQDKRCKVTVLSLKCNDIRDEGAMNLFENALTKENCKLTELNLTECSLTDQCISSLCMALQDERCKVTVLSLDRNHIVDKGAVNLFENALRIENCKLTELNLDKCSLTYQCISSLCMALQDERRKLTVLSLKLNGIMDKGAMNLFENAVTKENCKLTDLNLEWCSLTGQCIPRLCMALQNEHCKLNVLLLGGNSIADKGASMLFQNALTKQVCKLKRLNLQCCNLTDECIHDLCEALKHKHCRLKLLKVWDNYFTETGRQLLRHTTNFPSSGKRNLKIIV